MCLFKIRAFNYNVSHGVHLQLLVLLIPLSSISSSKLIKNLLAYANLLFKFTTICDCRREKAVKSANLILRYSRVRNGFTGEYNVNLVFRS